MTYTELLNRQKMQQVCNNLNYRHKMSQYAQRSSVALHTHLFFRQKVQDEDAYILFVRQNALQVLIPKFGLEGSIYLKEKDSDSSLCTYNPEVRLKKTNTLTVEDCSTDSNYVTRFRVLLKFMEILPSTHLIVSLCKSVSTRNMFSIRRSLCILYIRT